MIPPLDERGSAAAEFVLVGAMLTLLTLAVLQLGLALYVRNVAHDAAIEGAYHAALADVEPEDGAQRTRALIARAVGAGYGDEVGVGVAGADVVVTVQVRLPLIGLVGVPRGMEVSAHAPLQELD